MKMIRHVTDDLDFIGPSPVHVRGKPKLKDMQYADEARECLYSLLGTIYIPDDIARKMTMTYAEHGKCNLVKTIQTIVYRGDCYILHKTGDCYRLCRQLVEDFFPKDSRVRRIMIKAYTILIEEVGS